VAAALMDHLSGATKINYQGSGENSIILNNAFHFLIGTKPRITLANQDIIKENCY
jgi:hypothetical protein